MNMRVGAIFLAQTFFALSYFLSRVLACLAWDVAPHAVACFARITRSIASLRLRLRSAWTSQAQKKSPLLHPSYSTHRAFHVTFIEFVSISKPLTRFAHVTFSQNRTLFSQQFAYVVRLSRKERSEGRRPERSGSTALFERRTRSVRSGIPGPEPRPENKNAAGVRCNTRLQLSSAMRGIQALSGRDSIASASPD